jgi:hypothetical protein
MKEKKAGEKEKSNIRMGNDTKDQIAQTFHSLDNTNHGPKKWNYLCHGVIKDWILDPRLQVV